MLLCFRYSTLLLDVATPPSEGAIEGGAIEGGVGIGGEGGGPDGHPVGHKVAHFVAFVMHALTGWQPHTPVNLRQLFLRQRAKSAKLLKSLVSEGAVCVDEGDVVKEGIAFPWDRDPTPAAGTTDTTATGGGRGGRGGRGGAAAGESRGKSWDEGGDDLDAEIEAFELSCLDGGGSGKTGSFSGYTADFTVAGVRNKRVREEVKGISHGSETIAEGEDEDASQYADSRRKQTATGGAFSGEVGEEEEVQRQGQEEGFFR